MSGLNKGDIPSRQDWVVTATGKELAKPQQEKKGDGETGIPAIDQADRISKKIKDLMEGAKIDAVLGCLNRKALEEFLDNFVPRHDGAIVYLDFRDFKPINDDYGHNNGDEVLKEFVRQINANFRTTFEEDFLFRFGGDEFVLVCQHTSQETSFDDFMEKIREKLENLKIKVMIRTSKNALEVGVGVDYGMTGYFAAQNKDEKPNLREVMDLADQNMYAYKEKHKTASLARR